MRRREFITLLGWAAAMCPVRVRAQQPAMPVMGFLDGESVDGFADQVAAFRKGLRQVGAIEGQNIAIEYRSANGDYDQMPMLAADLVRRHVAVIFACGGDASAQAAKAATTTIPIVFILGGDPVASGLVESLARPGGNLTGVTLAISELQQKRLELLHQMVPTAGTIATLMNPGNPRTGSDKASIQLAAQKLGIRVSPVYARTSNEFDAALTSAAQMGAHAIDIAADPLFVKERERLVALVAQHRVPAMYQSATQVSAGGLMSYGPLDVDVYRQAGLYVGQILKGVRPAELPVMLPTRFDLNINLKTAKELGLEVPASLLVLADDVVE